MLTVSENGYGKRSSAYEYRISGRGGKGIIAMVVNQRNGKLVALLPRRGERSDHAGHRPRPAHPRAGRGHQHRGPLDPGVIVFDTAEDERVVAVEHIPDVENGGDEGATD